MVRLLHRVLETLVEGPALYWYPGHGVTNSQTRSDVGEGGMRSYCVYGEQGCEPMTSTEAQGLLFAQLRVLENALPVTTVHGDHAPHAQ